MATVKVNALCGGKNLNVFSLSLNQYHNRHHNFRIAVSSEWLEEKKAVNIDNSVNFLGKILELQITPVNNLSGEGLNFTGIVTAVNIDRSYTQDNLIVLKGFSPTYSLEDGPGCKSYEEKKGDDIFNEIVSKYPANLLYPSASGAYSEKIPYMVRYKETNYQFLSRLATIYGEWFYYTGQNLVYGKMEETNQVEISLGTDLKSYEYGVSMKPSNFEWLSNDYEKNHQFSNSSNSYSPPGLDAYGKKALNEANSKFPGGHKMPTMFDIKEEHLLKKRVEISKSCIVSNTTIFSGISTNPSLTIGTNLSVYANNKVSGNTEKAFINRFRVIGVHHRINQNKDYQNNFEALPFECTSPPVNDKVFIPKAEKHTAIVKENNDPEALGRVRVQFNWQEGNEMTPWIRVSTGHASGDRGIYFTPELEDEVIVDFEQGNPDQPYVCDAMYHGEAKPEHFDPDNNLKSIKTRSGHTVLLNDEDGKESITINDKNGNQIMIDTAGNNMTITALETMTFNAKNMNFEVGENMTSNIGMSKTLTIGENNTETVTGDRTVTISGNNTKTVSGNNSSTISGNDTNTVTGNLTMTSSANADLSATSNTNINGDSKVYISGADINVNGSSTIRVSSSDTDIV